MVVWGGGGGGGGTGIYACLKYELLGDSGGMPHTP